MCAFCFEATLFELGGNNSSLDTTVSVLDVAESLGATTFLDFVRKTNLTGNFTQTGSDIFRFIINKVYIVPCFTCTLHIIYTKSFLQFSFHMFKIFCANLKVTLHANMTNYST